MSMKVVYKEEDKGPMMHLGESLGHTMETDAQNMSSDLHMCSVSHPTIAK